MTELTYRELLRNLASLFPLPQEGIKILHRDKENFYLFPASAVERVVVPQVGGAKTEIPPLENSEEKRKDLANVVGDDDGAALGKIPESATATASYVRASEPKKLAYCEVKGFFGWHPAGQMYQLTDISFDDANGNTLFKGAACPGCIEQFRNQMKKEGTLFIEGMRQ